MEGFYPELWRGADVALSAGDIGLFTASTPLDIIAWGVTITASVDAGADGLAIAADKEIAGGTRGDGDVGTLSVGDTVDIADGTVVFTTHVSPALTDTPAQPHQLAAGDRVYLQVTDDGASDPGDGVPWVLYQRRHFDLQKVDTRTLAQGNRNANALHFDD